MRVLPVIHCYTERSWRNMTTSAETNERPPQGNDMPVADVFPSTVHETQRSWVRPDQADSCSFKHSEVIQTKTLANGKHIQIIQKMWCCRALFDEPWLSKHPLEGCSSWEKWHYFQKTSFSWGSLRILHLASMGCLQKTIVFRLTFDPGDQQSPVREDAHGVLK